MLTFLTILLLRLTPFWERPVIRGFQKRNTWLRRFFLVFSLLALPLTAPASSSKVLNNPGFVGGNVRTELELVDFVHHFHVDATGEAKGADGSAEHPFTTIMEAAPAIQKALRAGEATRLHIAAGVYCEDLRYDPDGPRGYSDRGTGKGAVLTISRVNYVSVIWPLPAPWSCLMRPEPFASTLIQRLQRICVTKFFCEYLRIFRSTKPESLRLGSGGEIGHPCFFFRKRTTSSCAISSFSTLLPALWVRLSP